MNRDERRQRREAKRSKGLLSYQEVEDILKQTPLVDTNAVDFSGYKVVDKSKPYIPPTTTPKPSVSSTSSGSGSFHRVTKQTIPKHERKTRMLVVSRKEHEEIYFKHEKTGELLRLMVIDIRGDRCRIGIEAPKEWVLLRSEIVHEQMTEEERKRFLNLT